MNSFLWQFKLLVKLIIYLIPYLKDYLAEIGFYKYGLGSSNSIFSPFTSFCHHYSNCKSNKSIKNVLEIGSGPTNYALLAFSKHKLSSFTQLEVFHPLHSVSDLQYEQCSEFVSYSEFIHSKSLITSGDYSFYLSTLKNLEALEKNKYDFIYSHSVLQHIHRDKILFYLENLTRLSSNSCIQSHYIDFRDFLSPSFNVYIFPDLLYESKLFHEAGFYCNRLRPSFYFDYYKRAGFSINIIKEKYFPKPLPAKLLEFYPQYFKNSLDLTLSGLTFTATKSSDA